MKKILLIFIIILTSLQSFTQEKIDWVDLDEIIKQTLEYEKERDYEKALDEINKVPKNDSAYYSSLTSKAYYLINTEQNEEAIKVTEEGLKAKYHPFKYYFMLNNAAAYLNLKDYKTAIKKYDEILKKYPKNYLAYYNKGVAYEGLKDFEKASQMYQTSIRYNPFYSNSHLKLGALCYQEHHIAQTMMCLNMYLLINPDGSNSFNVLKSYNNMVKIKNDSKKTPGIKLSEDDDSFEEIDLIINNYVALNKKYKISNKINLAIIKQNHALLKQLENYEGNGGFWDKYYVPFYLFINEKRFFNSFSYTISYSVENEKYKGIINKNVSNIKSFIPVYQSKWAEIIGNNTELINGEKKKVVYAYNNSQIEGFGQYKEDIPIGEWVLFNNYGGISSKRFFDEEGKKHGKWVWFNKNGKISKKVEYNHDELINQYLVYHDNGKLKFHANYKEGKLNGEYKRYNENGALVELINYVNGKYNGEYYTFYSIGQGFIEYKIPYKEGKIEGIVYEYYPDGKVKSEIPFKGSKRNGTEKRFYHNGKIETQKEFVDGQLEGEYVEYHFNGNLYQKGIASDGFFNGPWKTYYSNNIVEKEMNYLKGNIDGIMKKYDRNKKLFYEYNYRKGEIIAYKFFNQKQEVIKEAKKQKGEFFYEGHATNGNITTEGLYDISGGKMGEWKFYSENHVLESSEFNEAGKLQGMLTKYHSNGEIESIAPYEKDTLNGYFSSFYPNKQLKQQGWYKNGKAEGEWINYYPDGTLQNKDYYSNGKLYGISEGYAVDGKIEGKDFYYDGKLMSEFFFNVKGEIVDSVHHEISDSSYNLISRFVNGKPLNNYTMLYNKKHGKYIGYYFNGKIKAEGNYFNGERNGEWVWYHQNGKIKTKGSYILGDREGKWFYYYKNGNIESEDFYVTGYAKGLFKSYNEKGILTQSREFENNDLHGEIKFYSEEGKLQLIRYYNYNRLIGYSYLDKNSKILPMIPIKNETAKITAYFDNGKVSRELEYVNGEFNNVYKEYYYSGQLFEVQSYKNDEREGEHIIYYPDGTLKEKRTYAMGNTNGEIKKYHPNGKIKEHYSDVIHGVYNGLCKIYDASGKLLIEKEYFDGLVFSEKTY